MISEFSQKFITEDGLKAFANKAKSCFEIKALNLDCSTTHPENIYGYKIFTNLTEDDSFDTVNLQINALTADKKVVNSFVCLNSNPEYSYIYNLGEGRVTNAICQLVSGTNYIITFFLQNAISGEVKTSVLGKAKDKFKVTKIEKRDTAFKQGEGASITNIIDYFDNVKIDPISNSEIEETLSPFTEPVLLRWNGETVDENSSIEVKGYNTYTNYIFSLTSSNPDELVALQLISTPSTLSIEKISAKEWRISSFVAGTFKLSLTSPINSAFSKQLILNVL